MGGEREATRQKAGVCTWRPTGCRCLHREILKSNGASNAREFRTRGIYTHARVWTEPGGHRYDALVYERKSSGGGLRILLTDTGRLVWNQVSNITVFAPYRTARAAALASPRPVCQVMAIPATVLPAMEPPPGNTPPMYLIAAMRSGQLCVRDGRVEPVVPMPGWTWQGATSESPSSLSSRQLSARVDANLAWWRSHVAGVAAMQDGLSAAEQSRHIRSDQIRSDHLILSYPILPD